MICDVFLTSIEQRQKKVENTSYKETANSEKIAITVILPP
jgi:hypothetical protein